MRFMMLMIPGGDDGAGPGAMLTGEAVEAMTRYNDDLRRAGALVALEGLYPPSLGARVRFDGAGPPVTDRPLDETRDAAGGYWVIDVRSRREAIDWARRCPASPDAVIDIRRVFDVGDFAQGLGA